MGDRDERRLKSRAELARGAEDSIISRQARPGHTTNDRRRARVGPRPGRRRLEATEHGRRTVPGEEADSPQATGRDPDAASKRHPGRRGGQLAGLESLPVVVAVLVLVVYFAWVCVQMAAHTPSGNGLLVGIFGGAAAGVAALLLGLWLGR
jgi:hypothetical protein